MARTIILIVVWVLCVACVPRSDVLAARCEADPALVEWITSALERSDALVFGELHGNNESPAAFKQMVCATLATGQPALVGLELPESAVDSIRSAAADPGSVASAGTAFWEQAHDGRTSEAMFDLVEWLLSLEASGRIALVGFDMRVTGREPFGATSGMHLRRARLRAGEATQKILVLAGRGHSDFTEDGHSIPEDFATYGIATLAVELVPAGGSSWVCRFGHCGVSDSPRGGCDMGGGVPGAYEELDVHRRRATLCLGAVTPSLPKVQ